MECETFVNVAEYKVQVVDIYIIYVPHHHTLQVANRARLHVYTLINA